MKKKILICYNCKYVSFTKEDDRLPFNWICPKCFYHSYYYKDIEPEKFDKNILIKQPYWINKQLINLEGEEREKKRRELEVKLKKEVLEKI